MLLVEAGSQTVVYGSLVWGAQTLMRKISSHSGSSAWTPMRSAFFPFFAFQPDIPFDLLSTGAVN